MTRAMSDPRALEAARRAFTALGRSETKDAAWFALWSVELDPEQGFGWALLGRILHEVSGDALATLTVGAALDMPMPEPERTMVGRFHRIDLWSRGLLVHQDGASLLTAADFDDPAAFEAEPELEAWTTEALGRWADTAHARRAAARLVGALSDAWEMPTDGDPLRGDDSWAPMPEFQAWRDADPLAQPAPEPLEEQDPATITVLSDAWTARAIEAVEENQELSEAMELAEQWVELRPGRVLPLVTALRLADADGDAERADELEQELLALETEDLAELEEARVGLGLMGRFPALLAVLERMNALAPGHPVILANRAAVRLEMGEQAEAEADLRLALELDPTNGPAMTNMALIRLRENDHVAARALLEEAKRLYPDEAQVRYYLAACLQNQSHPEAAIREAEKALALDPEFEAAKTLLAELRSPS